MLEIMARRPEIEGEDAGFSLWISGGRGSRRSRITFEENEGKKGTFGNNRTNRTNAQIFNWFYGEIETSE